MLPTHPITIAGVKRDLPLFEVAPGVTIALFNMLGDTEIVEAAAKALAKQLPKTVEVLVTAEAKSIPLAFELSRLTRVPYVVARKSCKPYMGQAISAKVLSITTGTPQTLWLDEKDRVLLKNKSVALVDDVISTGSTLEGLQSLVKKAKAKVVAEMAVFTEGDQRKWGNVIALGHLPVWVIASPGHQPRRGNLQKKKKT